MVCVMWNWITAGIDIRANRERRRAVFNGEVSAIFQYNGLNNILVRHGNYISVYCNLSSVSVSKGSKVNTRTVLGTIHTDSSGNTVLHFQLRKETAKLNPELWLGRWKKDKSLSVFYYFAVSRSLFGNWRISVVPVPEISSIIIPSTESIWYCCYKECLIWLEIGYLLICTG